MNRSLLLSVAIAGLAALGFGCSRDSHAAVHSGVETQPAPSLPSACDHAACGDGFFIDAVPLADCRAGAACNLAVKLVATGDYHINDEYPYKFKADDSPGVEFLGSDTGGKNVFSKFAGSWAKNDERTGTMAVAFMPIDTGVKRIGGTFKFSVCSRQNCKLDQQQVSASVPATR
jgi:hypothetical protein